MKDHNNRLNSVLRRCRFTLIALVLLTGPAAALRVAAADCFSAPAGLVGWWPGDGNANDIAGTNNGVLEGGATASATGVVGLAFTFNGTNGYVQIPDSSVLKPTNLTVEAWVLFNSLDSAGSGSSPAGQQYIVFKQNSRSSNFEGYDLGKWRVTGGDVFAFRVSSSSAQLAELLSATFVTTGVWYHVAGVRGSNFTQIYVNGALEGQTNVTFAQDYGTNALFFGTSGESSWDHKFYGLLDEVSLYNRALSSNEVAAIYAAGAAGKCKGASIIAQPQSQAVLMGSNVAFTVAAAGFGTLSYQWQFNGAAIPGATGTNLALSNVQPANAGSFSVVVTNSLGSATSAVAVLTVLVPPGITSQPESLIVTNGTAVSFSVAAAGTAPLAYQWLKDGTDVPGASNATYAIAAATTNDAASYTVVITNVAGAVTSSVATLTVVVTALPFITAQPVSQSVIAGSGATFSVTVFSTLPLSYQWQLNGSDLEGATGASLALANVQPANGGDYTVVITNAQGGVTSAVATLTVLVPPAITVQPAGLVAVAGTDVALSVTASGTQPLSYQWWFNGAALAGATGANLTLNNVQQTNAGNYKVVVTNSAGSVTSAVASLTVNLPPAITGQPASQALVAGSDALFTVAASGTAPLSYRWLFNGTNLADGGQFNGTTNAALSISNVQSANAGAYSVVVTNSAGSATSALATLMVNPPGLCVSSPAGLISWWPGDGNANDIAGTNNGALEGGATASAAGLDGAAFGFDGTNGYVQIPDSPDFHLTNLTIEAWVFFSSLDSAGSGGSPAGEQYIVFKQNSRSTSFEGFALTKVRVTGADHFDFEVTSASGQSAELTSVSAVTTGAWYHVAGVRGSNFTQIYINGALQGQSNITFAQDYGTLPLYFGSSGESSWDHKLAGALDEVSLYNRALSSNEVAAIYAAGAAGKCKAINITAQPQGRTVVVGANVTLTVAASGSTPLGYQWQRDGVNLADGGNISGANSAVLSLANVSVNDSASYQVLIGNMVGLVTSAVAILNVDSSLTLPTITAQPVSQGAVAGTNVTLAVAASGTSPLSYQWLFNGANLAEGGQFSGTTNSMLTINFVLPANAGSYSVVVTNLVGAVTSAVATLTVSPPTGCLAAPAGLVGWWPGDGNANDIIGTNNGALEGNAVADASGVDGQAFSFDGTNGYVQIPDSPVFHPTNLTVECWVRFDAYQTPGDTYYSNQQYIVFKQNSRSGEFEGFALTKDHDPQGDVFLWEVASAAGELVRIDSVSTVVTGVWYHVAGVRGPDYTQLYKDGQLEVQTNVDFPQDYGTFPLYFGTSGQSYYDRRLHGELDEVSLYNRALSADEIAAL
ncbi:MAG: immunoglobulin domain-containing protein, partial [Verrucomicrobiota bacterium]